MTMGGDILRVNEVNLETNIFGSDCHFFFDGGIYYIQFI